MATQFSPEWVRVAHLLVVEVNQFDGQGRLEEDAWDGSHAYALSHIWHHESNAYPVILKKANHQLRSVETYERSNK